MTTEEAAYNALTVFFSGTPAAGYYGGEMGVGAGVCGSALMQYLEVPYLDVLNALTLPPPTTPSSIPGLGTTSLQDLLIKASQDLSRDSGRASTNLPVIRGAAEANCRWLCFAPPRHRDWR